MNNKNDSFFIIICTLSKQILTLLYLKYSIVLKLTLLKI